MRTGSESLSTRFINRIDVHVKPLQYLGVMDEYDEYDNYFSPLFIEEALPQTSQECASPPEVPGGIVAPGAARIAIEIERPTDDVLKASKSPEDIPNKTPYSQFRGKRGYLSVSDIVSPIWFVPSRRQTEGHAR